MDQLMEMTNNIYDGGLLDGGFLPKEDIFSPTTMIMSLMVTMLPKLVPHIMPHFVNRLHPESKSDKFHDRDYMLEMETMFKNKFAENLRMVVDILDEDAYGEKVARTGEKGRLATLISTTLEAINVDASQFDGSKMTDLADLVEGRSPKSAFYDMAANAIIAVFSPVFSTLFSGIF